MTITMADMASDAGLPPPKEVKKPKKGTEGADRAVVDAVKEELRSLIAATLDKGTDDIGDLLLKRFYGDDPERYGGQNPDNPSLNLLLEECSEHDLHVSRTFLGNALRSTVFRRRLGDESSFSKLDPSHRVELLCLGDPHDEEVRNEVEAFAEESLVNEYSVRKLRDEVEEHRNNGIRKKAVSRTLGACVRNMTDRATGQLAFTAEDFELPSRQLDHVERQALALIEHAEAVVELVRAQRAKAKTAEAEASTAVVAKAKAAKPKGEQGEGKAAEPVAAKKVDGPPPGKPDKPEVKTAVADAGTPTGMPEKGAPKPSRRRDGDKAGPSVAKAKGRAVAEKPAP